MENPLPSSQALFFSPTDLDRLLEMNNEEDNKKGKNKRNIYSFDVEEHLLLFSECA